MLFPSFCAPEWLGFDQVCLASGVELLKAWASSTRGMKAPECRYVETDMSSETRAAVYVKDRAVHVAVGHQEQHGISSLVSAAPPVKRMFLGHHTHIGIALVTHRFADQRCIDGTRRKSVYSAWGQFQRKSARQHLKRRAGAGHNRRAISVRAMCQRPRHKRDRCIRCQPFAKRAQDMHDRPDAFVIGAPE